MSKNKKILIIFGTRPELIKLYPLINVIKNNYNLKLFFTSQHDILIENLIIKFDLKKNIISNNNIKNSSIYDFLSSGIKNLSKIIQKVKPDLVIAQGDTSSTYLAALCSMINKRKFAHLEAGLRTYDNYNPFPEESFRQMISRISDYNFCPTKKNYNNLVSEGIDKNKIFITGNTIIDSLKFFLVKQKSIKYKSKKNLSILITLHRRENFMEYKYELINNLKKLINHFPRYDFNIIKHANPLVKKSLLELRKYKFKNLNFLNPKDYQEFINFLSNKDIIISDSGGIQEECLTLKKPLIVFRENTERKEGLIYNTVILSKPSKNSLLTDFEKIVRLTLNGKLNFPIKNPYGDGRSSKRILNLINRLI